MFLDFEMVPAIIVDHVGCTVGGGELGHVELIVQQVFEVD
jgi:hypothetical protein